MSVGKSYRFLYGFIAGLAASVVLVLATDFALRLATTIHITNVVGMDLSRVEVSWADVTAWSGSLKDGEKHEIVGTPPGEGSFRVHIETADGRKLTSEFGYATPFLGGKYFVTARDPVGGVFEATIVWCESGLFTRSCTS
jgi:hypothetical protein